MNVVIVDGDISYPPTSGKRLRTLHLMLPLARRHRVTYICRGQAESAETRGAVVFLRDHKIEPVVVDHPVARKAGPLFYLRLAGNLLSAQPYSVASHQSQAFRTAVGEHADRNKVDLWQFEWTGYVAALDQPGARKLVIAHNVDSLIWQRYHEAERRWLPRWYIGGQWRKFERFERRVFAAVDRVVAVSEDDAAIIRQRFGMPRVDVVDNGIDRAFFEQVTGRRDPQRMLFLGALDWRPNLDAISLLLDRIFPEVHRQMPGARLCIVGRNPPAGLKQRIAGCPGVELHADVADVRPFLASCELMVVPLRIGGGSRLKILEALGSGLPVVSTRVGAEGLCLTPGKDLVVSDHADDFPAALLEALRQPERMQDMARQARPRVLDRYDWNRLADKLEQVWVRCARGADIPE